MEVIAVLVILGVLATLAVPRIAGLSSSMDLQDARDQLVGDLRMARSMAQACAGTEVTVSNSNASGWTIVPDTDCGHSITRANTGVTVDGFAVIFQYPDGNPDAAEDIELSAGGSSVRVCIAADSGIITRCN